MRPWRIVVGCHVYGKLVVNFLSEQRTQATSSGASQAPRIMPPHVRSPGSPRSPDLHGHGTVLSPRSSPLLARDTHRDPIIRSRRWLPLPGTAVLLGDDCLPWCVACLLPCDTSSRSIPKVFPGYQMSMLGSMANFL